MQTVPSFRLPDTGVTQCYDRQGRPIAPPQPGAECYGQNGNFRVAPMQFSKLDAGGGELPFGAAWADGLRQVRDENTGLIWEIKSPLPGDVNFSGDRYTWLEAQESYVAKLNQARYGGACDWRVPNRDELRSIVDYGQSNPAVDPAYFPDCEVDFYWCSTSYEMQPEMGWGLFFGLGSGIVNGKTNARLVRAVRGGADPRFGQPDPARFVDNGDGTVTDRVTGLMWQQGENDRMDWFDALANCGKLRLGGYSDWRLPSIKELNTILNVRYTDGWWYFKSVFPAQGLVPPLLHYFSSTPHEQYYVWVTNFCFGYDGYYANKNAKLLHRAVRRVAPVPAQPEVFRLPDTGQVVCYDDESRRIATPRPGERFFGQDGSLTRYPMSFTKLRAGGAELPPAAAWTEGLRMVRDNRTGLVWEVKSPVAGDANFCGRRCAYAEALTDYPQELNRNAYGGYSDWRLPNREELRSIVDYSGCTPAVDSRYFGDCLPTFHWSRDIYGADDQLAWGVYFGYGCAICYLRSVPYHVRAVRGGFRPEFGDAASTCLHDNGNGTVSDLVTGLMWKQDESPALNFEEALRYCHELDLGGHRDWRLPNMKELPTLLDLSCSGGTWYHERFFPGTQTKPLGFYWASTTFGATFAWGINFQFGYDGYYAGKKQGRYPFRPVRDNGTPGS